LESFGNGSSDRLREIDYDGNIQLQPLYQTAHRFPSFDIDIDVTKLVERDRHDWSSVSVFCSGCSSRDRSGHGQQQFSATVSGSPIRL